MVKDDCMCASFDTCMQWHVSKLQELPSAVTILINSDAKSNKLHTCTHRHNRLMLVWMHKHTHKHTTHKHSHKHTHTRTRTHIHTHTHTYTHTHTHTHTHTNDRHQIKLISQCYAPLYQAILRNRNVQDLCNLTQHQNCTNELGQATGDVNKVGEQLPVKEAKWLPLYVILPSLPTTTTKLCKIIPKMNELQIQLITKMHWQSVSANVLVVGFSFSRCFSCWIRSAM